MLKRVSGRLNAAHSAAHPRVSPAVARPPESMSRLGLPRVLIVGCGDVGQRCLAMLRTRFRVFAVTSREAGRAALREAGAVPVLANLDDAASLRRLRGLSQRVLHLAPPPATGRDDPRTGALLHALARPARSPRATKHRILPERPRTSGPVSYTHLTLPTKEDECRSRWSPYH